jgi:hypothetical protein
MTRGPISFKGTDLKRAINTAKEAGLEVSHFEITKAGSIIVHVSKADGRVTEAGNPWDKAVGHDSG